MIARVALVCKKKGKVKKEHHRESESYKEMELLENHGRLTAKSLWMLEAVKASK